MKLGNLKAAIRATKGNPVIETKLFADGPTLTLALQKTALLEELDRAYPGGKAVETDLTFDEKTCILSAVEYGYVSPVSTSEAINDLTLDSDPLDLDLTGETVTASPAAESTGLDDLFV